MSQDNRKFQRIPQEIPVEYHIISLAEPRDHIPHALENTESANISEGGILIQSTQDVPKNSSLEVSFKLDDETIFMRGKVMHVSSMIRNGKRVFDLGISFGPAFEEDFARLRRWIAKRV